MVDEAARRDGFGQTQSTGMKHAVPHMSSFAVRDPKSTSNGVVPAEEEPPLAPDRSIGAFIQKARKLSDAQVKQIIVCQAELGLRFGEAAVALKLASNDDVLWALAQQFQYPYDPRQRNANPELVVAARPFSDESEVFRELRSQLLLGVMSPDQPRCALAIVSPDIGDGKTYLAANVAVAFSQLGGRTLLVDADLRTPRQQEMFGICDSPSGLGGILSGRAEKNVIQQLINLPSLFVLPAGTIPPNPLELVQRPSFGLLIHEMLKKFDHVVIDTPATVHGADSRVIAAKCGAALAIGRKGRTRMNAMNSLLSALSSGPSKLAGVVMNEF